MATESVSDSAEEADRYTLFMPGLTSAAETNLHRGKQLELIRLFYAPRLACFLTTTCQLMELGSVLCFLFPAHLIADYKFYIPVFSLLQYCS